MRCFHTGESRYPEQTRDAAGSIWQHRNDEVESFTKRYRVHRPVWFEAQPDAVSAIIREKQIKQWKRAWKRASIEAEYPQSRNLYETTV